MPFFVDANDFIPFEIMRKMGQLLGGIFGTTCMMVSD